MTNNEEKLELLRLLRVQDRIIGAFFGIVEDDPVFKATHPTTWKTLVAYCSGVSKEVKDKDAS